MDSLQKRLEYFLAESMHKDSSMIIRKLIHEIFNVTYQCDDFSLIDCVLSHRDYPKIFTNAIYQTLDQKSKTLKETSSLFTTYQSHYPFSAEKAYNQLTACAAVGGRLKLYEGFLLWFPDYFELLTSTQNVLMNENDFIPITWKYYIGIMAVSTIRCEYLLRELEIQFLLKGGEESWLIGGLNSVPEKLKCLSKINNILAHQPWKMKMQDLTEISSKFNSKGWNTTELTYAIFIMTNYHRLATVVEAMRLNVKETEPNSEDYIYKSESKLDKFTVEENNVKKIILTELELINNNERNQNKDYTHKRKPSEEKVKMNTSFESLISDNLKDFAKHISSYCTVYLDFDSHSEEYYSKIEFNWNDHGTYILDNFFPEGVSVINADIEYIINVSSNNIGGDPRKIDTNQYRNTICSYVEKIFGYADESFDYSKTNKLLHRTHKQFIKNIACSPQKITKLDIGVLKVTFSPEEIFHIILLVSVVKMRLQLTFFVQHLYSIIKNTD